MTTNFKQTHNYVICISTLIVLFFCMSLQSVLLINNARQNSTRNVQKCILLTKYIFIKPIHISNNVEHTNSKVNMKRSAIPCIPVYSPVAYVNLFLRYRTLCIAPTNTSTECLYTCERNTGKYTGECKTCKIYREGLNIRNFH